MEEKKETTGTIGTEAMIDVKGKANAIRSKAAVKKTASKAGKAKATPKAKAAKKGATPKKKVGGTKIWQRQLKPLREIVNISIAIRELEMKPSATLSKELKSHIRKVKDVLVKQGVTIPRRLNGRMETALKA